MNKLLTRRLITATVCISLLSNSLPIRAGEASEGAECCPGAGTVFAFFNGVLTTEASAKKSKEKLKFIHGDRDPTGQKMQYELMYNYTNGFDDFVETFEQRMKEHDNLLAGRYELFLATLNGGGDGPWWTGIQNAFGKPATDLLAAWGDNLLRADCPYVVICSPLVRGNFLGHGVASMPFPD